MFRLRALRSVFIASCGSRPLMNWRAIPETFQRRIGAVSHGKIFASLIPGWISGPKPSVIPVKYSSRCCTISSERRSEASTSTKRNICTLKASSFIEIAIIRW